MRATQVMTGLAMAAVIGMAASFPRIASGAPQLVGLTGPVVAPPASTGSLSGGQRAVGQARSARRESEKRSREADALTSDEGAGVPRVASEPASGPSGSGLAGVARVYTAGEVVASYASDPARAAREMPGKTVRVRGVVVETKEKDGRTVVLMVPENARPDSPSFVVRLPGTGRAFESGRVAEFEGTFAFQQTVEGLAAPVYYVDGFGEAGASAPGAAAGAAAEPEPAFAGWRFVGSVEDETGATGVFVRGTETLYAQAGDELGDGVRVEALRAGEARLRHRGASGTVLAW